MNNHDIDLIKPRWLGPCMSRVNTLGPEQNAIILQMTFSNTFYFFGENLCILIPISLEFDLGLNQQYASIGSDIGLLPNRQ